MIKANISNDLKHLKIQGHAKYAEYGKDIVCAAVSSIITTSINACLTLSSDSIKYTEKEGLVEINVLKDDETTIKLINNMINMLTELAKQYKKNITIIKED